MIVIANYDFIFEFKILNSCSEKLTKTKSSLMQTTQNDRVMSHQLQMNNKVPLWFYQFDVQAKQLKRTTPDRRSSLQE